MAEKITNLRNELTGHKAALTRFINRAEGILKEARGVHQQEGLHSVEDRIYKKLADKEDIIDALINKDSDNVTQYQTEMETEANRADKFTQKIMKVMNEIQTMKNARAQATLSSTSSSTGPKSTNNALKPEKLTKDHLPEELRAWLGRNECWCSTSKMDRNAAKDQIQYFLSVLDKELSSRMRGKITDKTPIRGKDGCLEILEKEFKALHPLLKRRFRFLMYQQSEGQKFTTYASLLEKKAKEADIDKMKPDDLLVLRFITGTNDGKLREKFL